MGHYGCTEPKIINRDDIFKFKTVQEYCKAYPETVKRIINAIDSVNTENLFIFEDKYIIDTIYNLKDIASKLKKYINPEVVNS